MENVLKYFEFSDFFIDQSGAFSNNQIAFTVLNETHFLIFEKVKNQYNLYVTKFEGGEKKIGTVKPSISELLIENYDKSLPEHRVTIRRYFE